jgi:hypothetical protein
MVRFPHRFRKINLDRQNQEELMVARIVSVLAVTALLMHLLDLTSFMVMVHKYGIGVEQNPFMRMLFTHYGFVGLAIVKLGGVLAGLILLLRLARRKQVYLAYFSLFLAAWMGWLGFYSNQV